MLKKIHTFFFKADIFWMYRYYKKRLPYITFWYYRFRKIESVPVTIDGTSILLSFDTPYHYLCANGYRKNPNADPILLSWKKTRAKRYYDIGGYNGIYGLLAAKAHPAAVIVIFEPDPINARQIRKNIAINDLTNCQIIEAAVTDKMGSVHFAAEGTTSGAISNEGVEVTAVTLDSLPQADIIKIDVEGAEMRVLSGMNYKSIIMLEVHPSKLKAFGDSENSLWELIEQKGYRNWFIDYQRGTGGEQEHWLLF